MYIQEIIIDGFKSYAQKTVVSGFDPQFNAITGLNGTGKSNILDSICFVLGISNLTQVRVGNLQELVYKQGQAGVTKATVTIVFNNADVSCSPVGYESHKQITVTRQVVIGGKNKYMINGHTVQQNQVQNMFHSVQLNVNNPHFLIMQGRITKVLNMKPMETLSMIEEAAGTRMFETKKQAAIKTIEKKQLKVDEISKCISEEISPTLEGLRNERKDYHSWQANNIEFERLERFCVASDYQDAQLKVQSADSARQLIVDDLESYIRTQSECSSKIDICMSKISDIERLRSNEMEVEFQSLKSTETELSKALVKTSTLLNNSKESLQTEKETLLSVVRQMESTDCQWKDKSRELDQSGAQLLAKEAEVQAADTLSAALCRKYQNACAGMADEAGAELLSLPEQVGAWEKREREAHSAVQQCQQKATYIRAQLKELQKAAAVQSNDSSSILIEVEQLQLKVSEAESRLQVVRAQDPALAQLDENSLRQQRHALQQSVAQSRDTVDRLTASLEARLRFEFRDPERGFDRSRVKGLVARLITVRDPGTSTALEIAAGSKLYQVVVDTEHTGKLLLQKGQLRKRITILPLNKINSRCTDAVKVQKAKAVAASMGGHARLALELVGYEEEMQKAMEYVFGASIVCSDADVARAVAFDRSIKTRTVTLEGDTYDPSGTLTGGSNNQIGALLSKIDELGRAQVALQIEEDQLSLVSKQLLAMDKQSGLAKDAVRDLDALRHALKLCQDRLSDCSYSQTVGRLSEMEAQLQALDDEMVAAKEQQGKAKEELSKLKGADKDNKKRREAAMKDMERGVKDSQRQASTLRSELLVLRNHRDKVTAEVKALSADLVALKEQHCAGEHSIAKLTSDLDELNKQLVATKTAFESAKQSASLKNQEMGRCSREVKELEREKESLSKEAQHASLEARKLTHKLQKWEKDARDLVQLVSSLEKQHPWISREKAFFGQEGSDFDFRGRDRDQCVRRHRELKAEQDRLAKKINKKVMGMIENAESEYEELTRKREVILNDKAKIEAVIEELDMKKSQALQNTWTKVNKDFGSIFAMLLPGVTAKLDPSEGCSVSEGLEVKVAFNGVWKDSLTELSGGQRSLLALSLILALLLFKPAPMYILDEVDAALDLSHTQNIGMMLRTHFSTSQFIVVSLKEGMFNNANVIFRTRFVDGVSAVTRTVANSKSKQLAVSAALLSHTAPSVGQQEDEPVDAPKKKKGKGVASRSGLQEASDAAAVLPLDL